MMATNTSPGVNPFAPRISMNLSGSSPAAGDTRKFQSALAMLKPTADHKLRDTLAKQNLANSQSGANSRLTALGKHKIFEGEPGARSALNTLASQGVAARIAEIKAEQATTGQVAPFRIGDNSTTDVLSRPLIGRVPSGQANAAAGVEGLKENVSRVVVTPPKKGENSKGSGVKQTTSIEKRKQSPKDLTRSFDQDKAGTDIRKEIKTRNDLPVAKGTKPKEVKSPKSPEKLVDSSTSVTLSKIWKTAAGDPAPSRKTGKSSVTGETGVFELDEKTGEYFIVK